MYQGIIVLVLYLWVVLYEWHLLSTALASRVILMAHKKKILCKADVPSVITLHFLMKCPNKCFFGKKQNSFFSPKSLLFVSSKHYIKQN